MGRRRLRDWLPGSGLGWVFALTTIVAWGIVLGMIVFVLAPTLGDRTTVGSHDWDQMESHRYLVTKTILAYHQFPFWNPYACGGHPNWGGFESGTTVVSPWLPFYLAMTLAARACASRSGAWRSSPRVGAWLLASRFTRSPAVRALVVVAFAVNGRWALQITSGPHLAPRLRVDAVGPLLLRPRGRPPTRRSARRDGGSSCSPGRASRSMVYMGGIYPLPQTILCVALYGSFLAATTRSCATGPRRGHVRRRRRSGSPRPSSCPSSRC